MAEVLGTVSAITTLVVLVAQVSSGVALVVEEYRSAPEKIQHALAELSSIEDALKQLESIMLEYQGHFGGAHPVEQLLAEPLNQCRKTCEKMKGLLPPDAAGARSVKARTQWLALERKKVVQLVGRLREHKATFNFVLMVVTSNYNAAVLDTVRQLQSEGLTKLQFDQALSKASDDSQKNTAVLFDRAFESMRHEFQILSSSTSRSIPRSLDPAPPADPHSPYLMKETYTYIAEKTYCFPAPRYRWDSVRVEQRKKDWRPSTTPALVLGRGVLKVMAVDNRNAQDSVVSGCGVQFTYLFPLWTFIQFAIVWTFLVEFDRRKRQLSISRSLAFPAVVDTNSDVMVFARLNNVAALRSLFLRGDARPTDTDISGITPLHWAVRRVVKPDDSLDTVKFLLQQGADLNASAGVEADTPLHWVATYATTRHARAVFRQLKDMGADSTLADCDGFSADDILDCLYGDVGHATAENHMGISLLMREAGRGAECDLRRLDRLLESEGVGQCDRGGWMALHWAAMGGAGAVIERVLRKGLESGFVRGESSRFGDGPRGVAKRYGNESAWSDALAACGIEGAEASA